MIFHAWQKIIRKFSPFIIYNKHSRKFTTHIIWKDFRNTQLKIDTTGELQSQLEFDNKALIYFFHKKNATINLKALFTRVEGDSTSETCVVLL